MPKDMVTPKRRRPATWLAGLVALGAASFGLACSDEPGPSEPVRAVAQDAEASDELDVIGGQLGRIHVVLQPKEDELEPEPGLQIRGRFIEYRGVSEDFVRARTNLPVPAWRQLVPGQCIASDALLPAASAPVGDNPDRELSLIDAGDLRVMVGGREIVAPLALVPDILPWLAGVEYTHVDDRLPRLAPAPDGTSPVFVSIDGAPEVGLDGFSVGASVPVALEVEAASVDDNRMTIHWRPPGDAARPIVLQLQAFAAADGVNEPRGEEVTCLVADTGRASLALAPLTQAGLSADAPLVRVSASRFDAVEVPAGEFGVVDVLVELRAQKILVIGA